MTPAFTILFLNSPSGMSAMKALAITTSGLFSLSVGKVRGIDVPVPSVDEQERIVAKVQRLMKFCDELESRLSLTSNVAAEFAEAAVLALPG